MTTNHKNETAMRAAGKAYLSAGASVIAILRTLATDKPDEAYINTLKFEFYLGGMLTVEPDEAKARAYIPDDNIVIKNDRCAFAPFDPSKASKKPQRPEHIEQVYHQMRSNWSNWRNVAGLPSLKAPPRQGNAGGTTETVKPESVTPTGLIVESGLTAATVVDYVRGFEDWLTRTFNANRDQVDKGHVGDVLRKMLPDMNAYLVDLKEALQKDTDAAPLPSVISRIEAAELAKSVKEKDAMLAEMRAEMVAMRDREAARIAELDREKADKAAKATARKAAKSA